MNNNPANHFKNLKDRILSFNNYEHDWGGENANIIAKTAIDNALKFLEHLNTCYPDKMPRGAAPSSNGEICMYWHDSQEYTEINFENNNICMRHDDEKFELIEEDSTVFMDQENSRIWSALHEILQKHENTQESLKQQKENNDE